MGAELAASSEAAGDKAPKRKIKVEVPRWCGQWVVGMDHFREGVVGAKSKNIAGALSRDPWGGLYPRCSGLVGFAP